MSLKKLLGGSGGFDPSAYTKEIISTSQTLVIPEHEGKMFVIVSGGGGGGFYDHSSIYYTFQIVGGASGELSYGFLEIASGTSVDITIGAGGASFAQGMYLNDLPSSGGTTDFGGLLEARGGGGGIGMQTGYDTDYSRYTTHVGFISNTVHPVDDSNDSTAGLSSISNITKTLVLPVETFDVPAASEWLRTDDTYSACRVGGANSIIGKGGEPLGDATTSIGVLGGGGGTSATNDATHGVGGDGFVIIYYIPA